jgi:hypothetical protein
MLRLNATHSAMGCQDGYSGAAFNIRATEEYSGGGFVGERAEWVERRLAAALANKLVSDFVFPATVIAEFTSLLDGDLHEPRKPAELDAIALRLGIANKGDA